MPAGGEAVHAEGAHLTSDLADLVIPSVGDDIVAS
jgi:hypothetical protein